MKSRTLSVIFAVLLATAAGVLGPAHAADAVYVNGYTRADGTYVQGHYRTAPNSTPCDNWSTAGNYNPYTGEAGGRRYAACSACGVQAAGTGYGETRSLTSTDRKEAIKYLSTLQAQRQAAAEAEREAKKAEREAAAAPPTGNRGAHR